MASNTNLPKCDIAKELDKVAVNITQLFGSLNTYTQSLENLEKKIDEESQACIRPSVASKFNDLRSLVHDVLRKVRSYKSCCLDVAEFGKGYEEEKMQTLNEMLSFVREINSYSSQLNKRVNAIITETGKAMNTFRELKANIASRQAQVQVHDEEGSPVCDCFTRLISTIFGTTNRVEQPVSAPPVSRERSVWREGEEKLENLDGEAQRLKEVVRMYSEGTVKCLANWPGESELGEYEGLRGGIGKIKASCTQLYQFMTRL